MAKRAKNQKIAQADGSWDVSPERRREIVPIRENRPKAPEVIARDELSLNIWEDTLDKLESMGLVCEEDKFLLVAFVLNYREMLTCFDELQKTGQTCATPSGGTKVSGEAANWKSLLTSHLRMLSELGLTPSGRASLAPPASAKKGEDDAVHDLLRRLGGQ